MIATLALTALLAAVLLVGLRWDLRRAVERRRRREHIRALGRAAGCLGAAVAMSGLLAEAVRAAADMERSMAKIRAAMGNEGASLDALEQLARDYREGRR